MGWKASAKLRRELIAAAGALIDNAARPPPEPDYVVVDLNTQLRLVTAGNAPTSARQAALRVLDRAFGKDNPQNAAVIIVADDKTKLPSIRHKVQRARLKELSPDQCVTAAARGKVIVGNRAFAPGKEPYSTEELDGLDTGDIKIPIQWDRLLNCPRGKGIAFNLLVKALKHVAQGVVRGDRFKMLLWHRGDTAYTFPNNWPPELVNAITDNAFGEADERVTEAIAAIQKFHSVESLDIVVKTIDTDMLIQMLVAPIQANGSITIHFKNEIVDGLKWRAYFGESLNERASRALLLTFASGCDYNSGLTPYGYLNKAIIAHASESASSVEPPFVFVDRETETCTVDTAQLARSLRQIPRRNKRKIPMEFAEELENAAYTVAYFSGIKRRAGGPEQQSAAHLFEATDPTESEYDAFVSQTGASPSTIVY